MRKLWLLGLKKMSTFTGMAQIIFTPEIIEYKSRIMTIQKHFANPKKIFRIDIV